MDLSSEAEARCCPEGEKAIEYTASVCPVSSTVGDCKIFLAVFSLTVPLAVNSKDPGRVTKAMSSPLCFFVLASSSLFSSSGSLRLTILDDQTDQELRRSRNMR